MNKHLGTQGLVHHSEDRNAENTTIPMIHNTTRATLSSIEYRDENFTYQQQYRTLESSPAEFHGT